MYVYQPGWFEKNKELIVYLWACLVNEREFSFPFFTYLKNN